MVVNIKKLVPEAVIPCYAKEGDAGMDLTAISVDYSNDQYIEYDTGLAVEIPEGYVGLVFPRSSNSKYDLQLCNAVGVIDSNYRGPIKFRFRRILKPCKEKYNDGKSCIDIQGFFANQLNTYNIGDRVGQLIVLPYPKIEFNEVDTLSETVRGEGGFGSTGK